MNKTIDQADLEGIQAIREKWDSVTEEELQDIRKYLGDAVSEYQFWLELNFSRSVADFERYAKEKGDL